MGARVDKTDSAVGVVRVAYDKDIDKADWGKVIGVGVNASGRLVKGAGNSGVIGVVIADHTRYRAGEIADVFKLADIVGNEGFKAGTKYFAAEDGTISETNTGTYVGYTVESDRLILAGF